MGTAIETKTAAEVANGPNDGITISTKWMSCYQGPKYIAPHGTAVIMLLCIKNLNPIV